MRRDDFASSFPGTLEPLSKGAVAFRPDPLPPELQLGQDIRDASDRALLALGGLREIIPSLPNPYLITRPFLRREAILSSRIEDTYTALEQLYLFEAEDSDRPPSRKESEEKQDTREVFNYVRALEQGLSELDGLPICNRLLKSTHARLMAGVRGKDKRPGEFRDVQNLIGRSFDLPGARFVPPSAADVESCMGNLERYIHTANDALPKLVRIALIHYQFEAIHPFHDGNGRVGRLLVSLLLAEYDILPQPLLYLSAYFERNRDQYVDHLLQISRRGAWTDWIRFFLEGVLTEAEDASRRARKLLDLREKYRTDMHTQGSGALLTLVDRLFDFPTITVLEATKLLHMTYRGARNNVEKLREHGIIVEVTGRSRNRIFIAKQIVELLESDRA